LSTIPILIFIFRAQIRPINLTQTAQAANESLDSAESDDERAVPLLLRGAALGRLGFYADSIASLQAAIDLEGRLRHDTYVPPFALCGPTLDTRTHLLSRVVRYELGAVHCAQAQTEDAKRVFEKCGAVSYDFNFEVRSARRGRVRWLTEVQVRFRMRLAGASAWMEQNK
jgi:hypothetical protein